MTHITHTQQEYCVDAQSLAQAELAQYMNEQAQAVAPEFLTSREIDFYEHEIYAGDKLVARITYDRANFVTEPWVVMVNGVEVFRRSWWQKCFDDTQWHYSRGTLPVQEPETPAATTGNEIMVQIAEACENLGLELLDDGIYRGDEKLGEVGFDSGWWVMKISQERTSCESVESAVRSLSVVPTLSYEQLLDLPFEQLTSQDWQRLQTYEPVIELVAA